MNLGRRHSMARSLYQGRFTLGWLVKKQLFKSIKRVKRQPWIILSESLDHLFYVLKSGLCDNMYTGYRDTSQPDFIFLLSMGQNALTRCCFHLYTSKSALVFALSDNVKEENRFSFFPEQKLTLKRNSMYPVLVMITISLWIWIT